jgi:hypothetical protein
MASDAQVREIELLHQYAARLDTFKDVILGGCIVLKHKADTIFDSIQKDGNQAKSIQDSCYNESSYVTKEYEEIVERYRLTTVNSVLLGSTADDARAKMDEICNCVAAINDEISKINSLVIGLQQRTAAYALVIRDMAGKGSEQLTKRCHILEKYKEQQI